jgi:hypothetical protein
MGCCSAGLLKRATRPTTALNSVHTRLLSSSHLRGFNGAGQREALQRLEGVSVQHRELALAGIPRSKLHTWVLQALC